LQEGDIFILRLEDAVKVKRLERITEDHIHFIFLLYLSYDENI